MCNALVFYVYCQLHFKISWELWLPRAAASSRSFNLLHSVALDSAHKCDFSFVISLLDWHCRGSVIYLCQCATYLFLGLLTLNLLSPWFRQHLAEEFYVANARLVLGLLTLNLLSLWCRQLLAEEFYFVAHRFPTIMCLICGAPAIDRVRHVFPNFNPAAHIRIVHLQYCSNNFFKTICFDFHEYDSFQFRQIVAFNIALGTKRTGLRPWRRDWRRPIAKLVRPSGSVPGDVRLQVFCSIVLALYQCFFVSECANGWVEYHLPVGFVFGAHLAHNADINVVSLRWEVVMEIFKTWAQW